MHQTMFDRNLGDLGGNVLEQGIDGLARTAVVPCDLPDRRPVGRSVARLLSRLGIDSKREKTVEIRLERRYIQSGSTYQVPVERLEMSEIKDQPVPLGTGPFIQCIRSKQCEKLIGGGAGGFQLA